MNCENCNSLLEPDTKFCGECGHPVPEQTAGGSPTAGAALSAQCSNCGSELEPGAQFCGECGAPTSDEVSQPASVDSEATVLEQPPRQPVQPVTPVPAPKQQVTPPVSPHLTKVESSTPQQPASPPPGTPVQQPVYQPMPPEPPKKGLSGCRIFLIIFGLVVICCVATMAIAWYAVNNMDIDYSTSGFEFLEDFLDEGFPFLDQLQDSDIPFFDQFLGDPTQDEFFDDFFGTQVNLTLRNDFAIPACFVYISPSDSDEWGDDWLGEEEIIDPGATRTFEFTRDQSVDISILDCDGNLIYEEYQITLTGEEVFITLDSTP